MTKYCKGHIQTRRAQKMFFTPVLHAGKTAERNKTGLRIRIRD
jgi:hypothetical protein